MNKKIRTLTLFLCFLLLFVLNQSISVNAEADKEYKIISDCPITSDNAKEWAKSKGATQDFIDLADLYWKYYKDCGRVNPGIAYAQSAKETGYGKFGGVLDESFCNPCGLKTEEGGSDSDAYAHEKFDSWEDGVQAHMDHLALYAGAEGYPKSKTYDPRHFKIIKGRCTTINELGGTGKWAPSETYGQEVQALYRSMLISAGIEKKDTVDNSTQNNKTNEKLNFTSVNTNVDNTINISSTIGWRQESGNWYYYSNDNRKMTGWVNPDGNWYYLNDSGAMSIGWKQSGQKWYYFNESGVMIRGWKCLNNVWYYFQGDGSMVSGLKQINGQNYYFNDNGTMVTGFVKINNCSYYFNSDGSMATGWIKVGNDEYYLDKTTGAMVKNSTIDGFKLDEGGKKTAKEESSNNPECKLPQPDNKVDKSKKIIAVDPGHAHGKDEGVKITTDGIEYNETDLDMEVAEKLKAELQKRGYAVAMTRTSNQKFENINESLAHRTDVANEANAAFYISIHHNTVSGIPEAKGVETYYSVDVKDDNYGGGLDNYMLEKSKQMAKLINDNIAKKINANNRGAKSDKNSAAGSLFVLRNTNMPAVLVETGFLSNDEEAKRCADSESQQLVAEAIAEIISQNI